MSAPAPRPPAIVTGAASGIGRAIALALRDAGHPVALVDRDAAGLAAMVAGAGEAGAPLLPISCDIAEAAALPGVVEQVAGRLGAPGVLVNNAAKGGGGRIETVTPETFDAVFAVSARAAFFLTQAAVPHMAARGGGRIVNIGSLIAARGAADNSHYAGAKAAQIGFTRAWAQEFAARQITVNAILPALTDTPMTRAAMDEAAIAAKVSAIPMNRLATPEDCAALTVFLASDGAAFLTGQVLSPNGGEFAGAL
jgi:NAD(P)-dependent dehydrogenase (short-subunit alcohol dehydrogenase family)